MDMLKETSQASCHHKHDIVTDQALKPKLNVTLLSLTVAAGAMNSSSLDWKWYVAVRCVPHAVNQHPQLLGLQQQLRVGQCQAVSHAAPVLQS
jgi:hypothetical protein